MEIFMHNIPVGYQEYDLKITLARHLHGPNFPNIKANFQVNLYWPKKGARTVSGTFTLVDLHVARRFLEFHGGFRCLEAIEIGGNRIYFQESENLPQREVLELLSRSRWVDPVEEREQNERFQKLYSSSLPLQSVQTGWMCRDRVFSVEGEVQLQCYLSFHPERREVQITFPPQKQQLNTYVFAIRQSSIVSTSAHITRGGQSIIYFRLEFPPTLLRRKSQKTLFYRLSVFPFKTLNPLATPYTSLSIRLVLASQNDLGRFFDLAKTAGLYHVQTYQVPTERRRLFTSVELDRVTKKVQLFDWPVAFQLEALLRNLDVDVTELSGLLPRVEELIESHGNFYVASLLKVFGAQVRNLSHDNRNTVERVLPCLDFCHQEFAKQDNLAVPFPGDKKFYQSFHATVTPTNIFLTGPFLEKSNRVIRRYDRVHQESFLRVEFREEDNLQYRLDRSVNGRVFIHDRLGPIFEEGLMIAGRKFDFLAYSQSALREHSVWFCKPFVDSAHGGVDAGKIIESLGSFENLSYDKDLIRCPARYAARLSQAFTATEAATTVRVENIIIEQDVKTRNKNYTFTDGSGNLSEDLAREIWQVIGPKREENKESFPHAYQIRFAGSKGMVSIDHRLNGSKTIALRPSMIKFDAPESKEIEIARAIHRPTPYHLNRPLIMLLEGLGACYEVFQRYQDEAVADTQNATHSLQQAAGLLEAHGLGSSFRLSSVMPGLSKLDIDTIRGDPFYDRLLRVAVYHVLRDLKNNARIPIPDAWTLAGVADTHNFLEEKEIFACIKKPDGKIIYLEGHVLVSRSPCIHPGDAQVAIAIGAPPKSSCFDIEPLPNTVVFSIKGKRPMPSCLGGGDLDGDVYNLLPLNHHQLGSLRYFEPAKYAPAERKLREGPSTKKDVADFVMEYIVSDVIGIVATHWLVIADQSQFGIQDRACLRLAQLHSDAVDYPKSGNPVNITDIPKLKFPKPDWSAPETVEPDPVNYYQSQSAVGRLSRAINLNEYEPLISPSQPGEGQVSPQRDPISEGSALEVGDARLKRAIEECVSGHIATDGAQDMASNDLIASLFSWFSGELAYIASECSLNHRHSKPLSEEELVIGTITQKTPQPRMRRDKISKMRQLTDALVRRAREVLEGEDGKPAEDYLRHAWMAWNLSLVEEKKHKFGARGFGWVALGAMLDAARALEESVEENK